MGIASSFNWDARFYKQLVATRRTFERAEVYEVPAGTGFGFRVNAGQVFRFVMVEGVQILDVCLYNAEDPSEHYDSPTQLAIEGSFITRFTRIWGTAPRSRPLATVLADSVRWRDNPFGFRDHKCYGAHCNPHEWAPLSATPVRSCYDNLRAALAMVGLSQRHIHDNMNLFEKMALDPYTGQHLHSRSDAETGDFLEFYAELNLILAVSLCPMGEGSAAPDYSSPTAWQGAAVPVHPIRIDILDTDTAPKEWTWE